MQTSLDGFLNGQLQIEQPKTGYRAGIDPVILAASVDAKPSQKVLELGTGVGTALLCLMARVGPLCAIGVDIQAELIDLGRNNAARNGLDVVFETSDIRNLPPQIQAMSFDHILVNPPFFDRRTSVAATNPVKEKGRGAQADLSIWIETALRRLRPKGYAHFILDCAQLPAALTAAASQHASVQVWPIAARQNRAPARLLFKIQKGGATPFKLFSPLIMHQGDSHKGDKNKDYSPQIEQVLRFGAQLLWPKG